MAEVLQWQSLRFNELDVDQLYELLKLRVDIFVVEQDCPYPELDEKDRDRQTQHLLGLDSTGKLQAYARVLGPGLSYQQSSIGRVAIAAKWRGKGQAHRLVLEAIHVAKQHWPKDGIKIGAQEYLLNFYQQCGFKSVSEVYLEDGIPHLDMLLVSSDSAV